MKLVGRRHAVSRVQRLRSEYGPEVDLMVDAGGGPLADAGGRDLAGPAAGARRIAILRG